MRLDVLLVGGESLARRALERSVRMLGHACRSAQDGEEAWRLHAADRADVILCDWNLPGQSAVDLCQRVREADADGAYTYFVFMTGIDDRELYLRGIQAGADDCRARPRDLAELDARLGAAARVVSLCHRLAENNAALRRDTRAWSRMARLDALTGVPNRLCMGRDLAMVWSRGQRYGRPTAMALCDIDRFKDLNDRLGHLAGDEALRRIATTLHTGLRECDGLYRYGGEEFLVILPEQTLADAAKVMDRVRTDVERQGIPSPSGGVVTISVGVTELDRSHDANLEHWIARTDHALYRAKRDGRNRVVAVLNTP
ncbi:MAG: diguanylate cyclase [Myxococcales bacterium]|nr:diguanylate cyclase [Myxococcales bacterium]